MSLGAYENTAIGRQIVEMVPNLQNEIQVAALAVLASRSDWSRELLSAIQAERVRISDIPEDIVARLRSHNEDRLNADLTELFPEKRQPVSASSQQQIALIEDVLRTGTGNPYQGESIYMERCASCHKLFFKGGNIGPDLTNYQRDNLGTMLTSVVDPNSDIREGYQYYLIETADERSLSGFLVERDSQVTVLRGLEGEDITLRQSDILETRSMERSLMPEGLLGDLDDQQLRDLFAYLRISQPITR